MTITSIRAALRVVVAALAITVATVATGAPQFHGAIYTSVADGTTVNANLYDAKSHVYLNGGPQNLHAAGLPNGTYYFQITNPNGAVLLSTDPVVCRQLSVVNGAVSGATGPSCKHANGIFNTANGSMPVQMIPFLDTPNNGGEYKAFLVSQDAGIGCGPDKVFAATDGIGLEFPLSCAKTDNFKVRKPLDANIVACKFNDLNGNGAQDPGEPTIAGWPITATNVADANGAPFQTVTTVTGDDGCVAFTVPAASNVPVTLTEGTDANWYQTAPANGSYPPSGTSPAYVVAGGAVSAVISGPQILDIDFGNRKALRVSKTAKPSYKINWSIAKNVDNTEIKTSNTSAVFNYTVNVSHDTGSDFKVTGNITLNNDSPTAITGVNVSDIVDNGASCVVTGGTGVTVPANGQVVLSYVCTYSTLPASGTNTATATWGVGGSSAGTAAVDFSATVPSDASVTVTDTLGGSLGTVNYTDASPKAFTYPVTVTGTAGTCVSKDNTATFTTNTSATTGSSSKTVKLCVGTDLTVAKDAKPMFTRTYTWAISKEVDKTYIAQSGDTATFNYTVNASQTGVADSGWQVTGSITVTNPNDWQDITVNVGDAINNGGACTVVGGASLLVLKSASATATYTCTYAAAPSASAFTNTGTATWDSAAAYTPSGTASGTASGGFTTPTTTVDPAITVTDTFDSVTTTLGTLTATNAAPFAAQTFTYPHTVTGTAGTCVSKNNTATFTSTSSSTTGSSKTVTVKLCVGKDLTVAKSATATFTRTYTWDITKDVDKTYIAQSSDTAAFNYTVLAKQTGVVDSGWLVTGTITVTNPNDWQAITVNVSDAINNGGTCVVTGGANLSVAQSASATATYACSYSATPSPLAFTNTATATWNAATSATPTGTASGTMSGGFATPTTTVNPSITVTDTFNAVTTTLGMLTATNAPAFAAQTFTYSHTVTAPVGSCVSASNTAVFRSNTTATTGSASKTVRLCVGADLTVAKTASAAHKSDVAKSVDKTLVAQIGGGTATFTYTVNVTTSAWTVFGNITVTNPNDWQAITANLSDALSDAGGVCTVAGGASVAVAASASVTRAYTCSFASAPGANSGINTATASWDGAAAATPSSSGAGSANYGFTAVTVTDTFNGGAPTVLGTVNAAPGTASYSYTHTVPVPAFNCQPYANLAAIVGGNSAPLVTVNVCGPAKTGALTKGFWQNKNGQGIILGGASTFGVCNSGTWLRQYVPYQDLSATASCAAVASYAMTLIKAADSSGSSMNPMLKAQMLATSFDVYFSDPALGLNKINAPAPIGGRNVDLTKICKDIGACTNFENVSSVFGPANSLTVLQMLAFAGSPPQSNVGGTNWYGQVKATQELAKDAFDAINNEKMFSP